MICVCVGQSGKMLNTQCCCGYLHGHPPYQTPDAQHQHQSFIVEQLVSDVALQTVSYRTQMVRGELFTACQGCDRTERFLSYSQKSDCPCGGPSHHAAKVAWYLLKLQAPAFQRMRRRASTSSICCSPLGLGSTEADSLALTSAVWSSCWLPSALTGPSGDYQPQYSRSISRAHQGMSDEGACLLRQAQLAWA